MPSRLFAFFLAHAGADRDFARDLYDALVPEPCFLDAVTLAGGDRWQGDLVAAQAASRATVVLLSRDVDAAYYLSEEIARAIDLMRREQHRVIPVYLERRPTTSTDVPYGLFSLQGLDATTLGVAGVAAELMARVHQIPAAPTGAPTPRPPPTARAPSPPASPLQLLNAAIALNSMSMLEEVARFHLDAPIAHFRTATVAMFAMDLVGWAREKGDPARSELEAYLREKAPMRFR